MVALLAVLSAGNGLLNVGLAAMVSAAAGEERQSSAFGVTQGAGSLGRAVMTAVYVLVYWAPFLLGAVLVAGVVATLVGLERRE